MAPEGTCLEAQDSAFGSLASLCPSAPSSPSQLIGSVEPQAPVSLGFHMLPVVFGLDKMRSTLEHMQTSATAFPAQGFAVDHLILDSVTSGVHGLGC